MQDSHVYVRRARNNRGFRPPLTAILSYLFFFSWIWCASRAVFLLLCWSRNTYVCTSSSQQQRAGEVFAPLLLLLYLVTTGFTRQLGGTLIASFSLMYRKESIVVHKKKTKRGKTNNDRFH
ncbi:unnamed protein product [Laminaria digitata]